jgi:peroxiredoxin
MKTKLLIGSVLLALIVSLSFQKLGFASGAVGDTAEEFTLPKADGGSFSLSDHKGKNNVILIFWAINAPYCAFELEGIRDKYAEIQKNGFEVAAVNKKDQDEKAKEFVSKEKLTYPVLLDAEGKVAKLYEVTGLPVYLIIDKQGQIKWRGYEFPKEYQKLAQE